LKGDSGIDALREPWNTFHRMLSMFRNVLSSFKSQNCL
jgi:hypothetical protein